MSRSRRCPPPRAATGRPGCPSPTSSPPTLGPPPTVLRDRHELVEGGRELLVPRPFEAPPEDRHELALRPAVDEDDEPEAKPVLVQTVQLRQLRGLVGALLGG